MRAVVTPGGEVGGVVRVPGDKSIAHRWLLLAAIADGTSRLTDVPASLDVRSTAACIATVAPKARPSLDLWADDAGSRVEGGGSTWNSGETAEPATTLEVEGEGVEGLRVASHPLDCGNSGTTMRLLSGMLAGRPFTSVLTGDASLRARPMERVAAPLREMGADVTTIDGHAPVTVSGGRLQGIDHRMATPSAQVKGAILLAGLQADGRTTVVEAATTRDHTERALAALGAPVGAQDGSVWVERGGFGGFAARVPGDVSSAAFVAGGAAILGSSVEVAGVGLNPSRLHLLEVLRRMGASAEIREETVELGEPVGRLTVARAGRLLATTVDAAELPLVIDEVPLLAAVAAHAEGSTRFAGVGELRVKESDRVRAIVRGLADLGGRAWTEGDDLVVEGGGIRGGASQAGGDHRIAMALVVAALGATHPSTIDGVDAAEVSFPGFVGTLAAAGATIEEAS
jgi:3-phosphoshikimate 1-carboxyvinyltransferase